MTDNELLELAAKALGRKIEYISGVLVLEEDDNSDYGVSWNPLTDDGDALRLANLLGLVVDFSSTMTMVESPYSIQDKCHRRAIVRAAAEIGKTMP